MTSIEHHAESPELLFAALLRLSDRERILVQVMALVGETILQLPRRPLLRREVRPSCMDGSPKR
jgi:hypothetical protein